MIETTFKEAHSEEWVKQNITDLTNELVIMRKIIPWDSLVSQLSKLYNSQKGRVGKSIRMLAGLLIISKFRLLSDEAVIKQAKENRYIQYFCNIPDEGLGTFLHPTTLFLARKRFGEKGAAIIEKKVFEILRKAGIIEGDNALIDSTVLESNIVYPTDVKLIYKAFCKIENYCKTYNIPLWWDNDEVKKIWRSFNLSKDKDSSTCLLELTVIFQHALNVFRSEVKSVKISKDKKKKINKLLDILILLYEQNELKIQGEKYIKNRIVSIDEPEARPIKKGKQHPECEFGTKCQASFNRQGFMITVENFVGNPSDKTLYSDTIKLFHERMKQYPETVVTDKGYRSQDNFKVGEEITNKFFGKNEDIVENKQNFCNKARSATEGFIAVAKHWRGFKRSLYKGIKGDKIWSLLSQTAYNLKKFLQLYYNEKLEEKSLVKLGLLA